MDLGLKYSVIAVTGGGASIEQGISLAYLREGDRAVILSRNSDDCCGACGNRSMQEGH